MSSGHWVAGHLTGGLGNRLFQHAAAAGLAEKIGRPLVFHLPSCAPTGHGPFNTIFQMFPNISILQEDTQTFYLHEPQGSVFTYHPFETDVLQRAAQNLVVDGWRQSPLYFPSTGINPSWETLLPQEKRAELLRTYGLDTAEKRKSTWFAHVRLGDYLLLPHHQIDLGFYYSNAMKEIPPGSTLLLFSDQAREFRDILERLFQSGGHQARLVFEPDEAVALYLMSQCWGGAIVANSTFSWWGSYFAYSNTDEKQSYKAVFPTSWGQGLPPARDILPSWGIGIKNAE